VQCQRFWSLLLSTIGNRSFQNELPKARVNIKLDLHTGGASRRLRTRTSDIEVAPIFARVQIKPAG
jgi:hypothetical protein